MPYLRKLNRQNQVYIRIAIIVIFCVLLTLANLYYTKVNPGGVDFLVNWTGTRELITNGASPYSSDTTQMIQNNLAETRAMDGNTEPRFSIPLYGILLLAPFALIKDFVFARALWMTILELAVVAVILLSLKLVYWKPRSFILIAMYLFGLFGLHGILPILDGNLIILMALSSLLVLILMREKMDELAGIMLAVTTILPAQMALFVIFILIRVITTGRKRIIFSFIGALGLLLGFSIAIIPNWFLQFLKNFINSYQGINPGSPGMVLIDRWGSIGNRFAIIIAIGIGLMILFEWWRVYRAEEKHFLWTAMTTIVLGTWLGIKNSPMNYVILYPAVIMGCALLYERWKGRVEGIITTLFALLFFANWAIFLLTLSSEYKPGISSFLFIPLPVVTVFLLYWSKWWVLKSKKVEFDPTLIELQSK